MSYRAPLLFVAAVSVFAFALWQKHRGANALGAHHSWSRAVSEARDENRPLLINFGGPW